MVAPRYSHMYSLDFSFRRYIPLLVDSMVVLLVLEKTLTNFTGKFPVKMDAKTYLHHIQLGMPSQTVHSLVVDLSCQRKDHPLVEVHQNF